MLIDCDTCAVRGVHCDDCVVSVFLGLPRVAGTETSGAETTTAGTGPSTVELDQPERDALGSLMAAGLVPPLRLVALPAPADPERGIA